MPILLAAMTVSFGESTIPHVQKYLGDNYEVCQDLEPVYGIPWEVKLAQGAFESGWGRSPGYKYANAVYGIKGKALHCTPEGEEYYLSYTNADGTRPEI
jgi:flagellum-specific peptidoglycan hydrolase FlgJ